MIFKDVLTAESTVMDSVLSTLSYYGIFKYPLKADEIYGSMSAPCSFASVLVALSDLDERGRIHRWGGYYSISEAVEEQVQRRLTANKMAMTKRKKAEWVGRFLGLFPFVRFVGISGSLSKGYADKNSDFDFFIVTAANRLWISRTILHLFKKLTFLAGQQHKFCMNYFIDTESLEIVEKNRFTAIELASLIPVSGYATYLLLESHNRWLQEYLPNGFVGFNTSSEVISDSGKPVKDIIEFVLDRLFPERMNRTLMRLTDIKWRRKWGRRNYPMQDYDLAFKTTIHISKNHPANHQKSVLNALL